MGRIISFAWTTPSLLAGQKTCTRRDWDHDYARRFAAGEDVLAFNRSPRARGVQLATIRLTAAPTFEPLSAMPDADYFGEGFAWMAEYPGSVPKTMDGAPFDHENLGWPAFRAWQRSDRTMWVIRFELIAYHGPNILKHVPDAQRALILASLPEKLRPLAGEAFGVSAVAL
jgi:hypothetical protein